MKRGVLSLLLVLGMCCGGVQGSAPPKVTEDDAILISLIDGFGNYCELNPGASTHGYQRIKHPGNVQTLLAQVEAYLDILRRWQNATDPQEKKLIREEKAAWEKRFCGSHCGRAKVIRRLINLAYSIRNNPNYNEERDGEMLWRVRDCLDELRELISGSRSVGRRVKVATGQTVGESFVALFEDAMNGNRDAIDAIMAQTKPVNDKHIRHLSFDMTAALLTGLSSNLMEYAETARLRGREQQDARKDIHTRIAATSEHIMAGYGTHLPRNRAMLILKVLARSLAFYLREFEQQRREFDGLIDSMRVLERHIATTKGGILTAKPPTVTAD
ncbi:MAG: hypothetical protein LBF66_03225 [Holosporales bacterium]|jgi:hypothetical protein|nr:hypothetical protein [Holosporales bacterium]